MLHHNPNYGEKNWKGPLADLLASRSGRVKLNHVYIWAGAPAESLEDARINKDPELTITTPAALLDQLAACLTHSTFFRE